MAEPPLLPQQRKQRSRSYVIVCFINPSDWTLFYNLHNRSTQIFSLSSYSTPPRSPAWKKGHHYLIYLIKLLNLPKVKSLRRSNGCSPGFQRPSLPLIMLHHSCLTGTRRQVFQMLGFSEGHALPSSKGLSHKNAKWWPLLTLPNLSE